MKNRIWFITGISSGLGKAIAQAAMEQGDYVIGTFRQMAQVEAFNERHQHLAFAMKMDLGKPADIDKALGLVKEKFGKVDVLVNNAGYGLAGAIEETDMQEARALFEANFFGTLGLTQAVLPLFRQQKSGHIIQISSHGGFKAFAGFGIYNASKFALEGFSEALAQEVAPLGIKVTIVEPGPFRTHFAGAGFKLAGQVIADYAPTSGHFRERIKGVNGKQEGDPEKAARAIFELSRLEAPPLRLPLGKAALDSLASKIESVQRDMDNFRRIAEGTVY